MKNIQMCTNIDINKLILCRRVKLVLLLISLLNAQTHIATFILHSTSIFFFTMLPIEQFSAARYFKLRKAFSKFYRRHSALLEKYSVSLKILLQQGISESEFYGDLVYRFKKVEVNLTFRSNSENLLTVIKELAIVWILCSRLYA